VKQERKEESGVFSISLSFSFIHGDFCYVGMKWGKKGKRHRRNKVSGIMTDDGKERSGLGWGL